MDVFQSSTFSFLMQQLRMLILTRHRCGCMLAKQMGGNSFRMYRLWVCLLATETVAMAAAARYWLLERA